MIKNSLQEIKYNERNGFSSPKVNFDINIIKPVPDDVVIMIKDRFPFCQDFDLSAEFEILRMDAALVKIKDESIPRQAEKNILLNDLCDAIKYLVKSIGNLDTYTQDELSLLMEKEMPGASDYINNDLLVNLQKLSNIIEKNGFNKDVGGRKKQNLKSFIVYKLLSIYSRGINNNISISYKNYGAQESYYGDTFDFLSMCNEYLQLDLGTPHNIVTLAKFYINKA